MTEDKFLQGYACAIRDLLFEDMGPIKHLDAIELLQRKLGARTFNEIQRETQEANFNCMEGI